MYTTFGATGAYESRRESINAATEGKAGYAQWTHTTTWDGVRCEVFAIEDYLIYYFSDIECPVITKDRIQVYLIPQ
ncbi:hypothetical protein H4R19_005050 [Coemansia spiralis]|nr:hypothetical protein H4R19_005050 [Coemansia spiralis]